MSTGQVRGDKLVELVIAGKELPLDLLLETLAPVKELRRLAKEFGLTPKGGFRIDKAPAHVLAPMLAGLKDAKQLDAVVRALAPLVAEAPTKGANRKEDAAGPDPAVAALERQLAELGKELQKSRDAAERQREREARLRNSLDQAEAEAARLRGLATKPAPVPQTASRVSKDELSARIRELEQEVEARDAANDALRKQAASDRRRLRELEIAKAELEELLPKGRRRAKPAPEPAAPVQEKRIRLPWFRPSFYKSLANMDQRSVAQAFEAVWTFCTYGPSYPALQVKQMGGQETWSMRAALALRVYFVLREDGDIDVVEVANREDQPTMLRRLKDR